MITLARKNQHQGWLPLFFNDFFRNDLLKSDLEVVNNTMPAVNVKETEKGYYVEVAAAGLTKDDFDVKIDEDNDLVITMEKKSENKEEEKGTRYLRREFSHTKFQQTMVLPDDVNKEKIDAKVENGLLVINLPKLSEKEIQKKQRAIAIS